MLVTPLGLMSCEIVRLLDTKLQSAGTRTVVRTLPCGARPAPPPWIFSFNELSLRSAAAHRGKKVKKQIMELANIIRDFHLLSLLVCGGVVCGVWRAGPGSPDARLGNVNCKIIVRVLNHCQDKDGVCQEEEEHWDTPVINDKFWRIDFLIVHVHRSG